METPKTPNCERLADSGVAAVRDFCEWLNDESLAIIPRGESHWPRELRTIDLIYKWAGIDARELENERRALLEWQRELNGLDKDGRCQERKATEAGTADESGKSQNPSQPNQDKPSRATKSSPTSTTSSPEPTAS